MSGFQLYHKIKEIDSTARACFLSAFEIYEQEIRMVFPSSDVDSIIKKPVSMTELARKVRERIVLTEPRLEIGSHVLLIFSNREAKVEYALQFLREGLQKNEDVILITNEVTKDLIRELIRDNYNIESLSFENNGDISLYTIEEWYMPDGRFDPERVSLSWKDAAEKSRSRGKAGLRIFADGNYFFKRNRGNDLVDYEPTLGTQLSIPAIIVCVYDKDDVDRLSHSKIVLRGQSHDPIWRR